MTQTSNDASELALKKARDAVHRDFDALLSAAQVDSIFNDSLDKLQGQGKFEDYVPALAEKLARDRLKGAALASGALSRSVPEVLFVALHDTGRGQMGAAIMRKLAGGKVNVHSAGTHGVAGTVDPMVAEAMNEIGIDMTTGFSKPLTDEVLNAADVIVTMGRSTGDVAIPAGARHVDWRIGDPGGGAPLIEVRHIRDEITSRVEQLLQEMLPD
ncbi:MAG TPA: low molecular weight phosphatase family protein [Gaiellaceae bacterium]|nr:low molecular weight phosphatase family protein [Gaiellaceae bacterium]